MKVLGPGASVYQPRVFAAVGFAAREHNATTHEPGGADLRRGWGCAPRLTYIKQQAQGAPEVSRPAAWYCLSFRPSDLHQIDNLLQRVGSIFRRMRASTMRPGVPLDEPVHVAGTDVREWNQWLESALELIREKQFDKVVAARFTQLTFARPPSVAHTLLALSVHHRDSTRFAFFRGRSVFLGATPERLITKRSRFVETAALAGTVWRQPGSDPTADMADKFGRKEYIEHSPVLDTILSLLKPLCSELSSDDNPTVCAQRDVFHLRTAVRGTLRSPTHVMSLVRLLHPTPAVAGRPTAAALAWIGEHETFDRGYYAGPIGWFDSQGDGQFDVALRSGIIRDNQLTLFGGAGIVEGSEPRREFDETTQKMQVLLGCVCHASEDPGHTSI
jgi:isochorismate synthase